MRNRQTNWVVGMLLVAAFCGGVSGEVEGGAPGNAEMFQKEMGLAAGAKDRDSRVEHLRKALEYRPGEKANVVIEYRIGIELSQREDLKAGQHPKPAEGLEVFLHIVKTYHHMDYYSSRMVDTSESPQLAVVGAATLAANMEMGLNGNMEKGRELAMQALEMLKETFDKRVEDWGKETEEKDPRPKEGDLFGGPMEVAKWESRQKAREQRKKDAAEGKVFGSLEMAWVKSAVRQYGMSYGRQKPEEVPAVMAELEKKFKGTPMAEVAREHAERAKAMEKKSKE